MAKPRKTWSKLAPSTQRRYRRYWEKRGLSQSQIRDRYNRGTLPLTEARGHAATPERPERALRQPTKYEQYIRRREERQQAPLVARGVRDKAYDNFYARCHMLKRYNDETVRLNVFYLMTEGEAQWTITADQSDIRHRASEQYPDNPWFYH